MEKFKTWVLASTKGLVRECRFFDPEDPVFDFSNEKKSDLFLDFEYGIEECLAEVATSQGKTVKEYIKQMYTITDFEDEIDYRIKALDVSVFLVLSGEV